MAIVEKAYTHYFGDDTYAGIVGEAPEQAMLGMNLTNTGDDWFHTYASSQALLNDIATKLDDGLALEIGVGAVPPGIPLITEHAYTVLGVNSRCQ